MDTTENSAALPRCQTIVYDDLLASLEGAINLALFLQEHLPAKWHDLYRASVDRPTNIVRFRHGSFEYVYDLYSQLEVTGEVPYDQTAEDRVVAICGTSTPYDSSNEPRRMRCWLGGSPPGKSRQRSLHCSLYRWSPRCKCLFTRS